MNITANPGEGSADFYVNVYDNSFSSNASLQLLSIEKTLSHYGNSSLYNQLSAKSGTQNILNEVGDDIDTRIEGNADANLVFVDAGNDRVGIGTATPAYKLDVAGTIAESGVPLAWYLIADSTLSSGDAANFDFTSIPATYKHLRLVLSLRSDRAAATNDDIGIRFNNDSGNNYDYLMQFVVHSAALSTAEGVTPVSAMRAGRAPAATAVASDFAKLTIEIPDYASTNINKDLSSIGVYRTGTSSGQIINYQANGHWRSAAAISRITIFPITGTNWKQYSRATLYGMK
jgi:hypothetical protein